VFLKSMCSTGRSIRRLGIIRLALRKAILRSTVFGSVIINKLVDYRNAGLAKLTVKCAAAKSWVILNLLKAAWSI